MMDCVNKVKAHGLDQSVRRCSQENRRGSEAGQQLETHPTFRGTRRRR